MSREEFLEAARAAATLASSESGLPAGITVAQAALESAWGRSELSRRAHNYFGIKAHGKHAAVEMPTAEVLRGTPVKTVARFARYASMADCFRDRDALILSAGAYAEARACAADAEMFARALGERWATDPRYADKLLAIYRQHQLEALNR